MFEKRRLPSFSGDLLFSRLLLILKNLSTLAKQQLGHFFQFLVFLLWYINRKILLFSLGFEKNKNVLVRFFMMKRGRYSRPFLHITAMAVLWIGVLLAPYLADTYPVFSSNANVLSAQTQAQAQSIVVDSDVFETEESVKPRDKVITYTVKNGDTISSIAKKYGISEDTIRWENDLTSDNITVGDELDILPVTGIAHKVQKGESVYTIAKKYDTNPQAIVDFPFNDFANPETFTLVEGQIVIVPEGVKPEEQPTYVRPRRQLATGPVDILPSGFAWPSQGYLSQYYTWYHPGIDIAGDVGTPVVAATNGTVSEVYTSGWNGGYGVHVIISGANGSTTLYAHMSGVNVSVGDSVSAGKTTIGWIGLTGRTTGPHVHFEVRTAGGSINPLSVLN